MQMSEMATLSGNESFHNNRRRAMKNFRYFLLFLATVSMTFIYSNRVVFGFTVICQKGGNESSSDIQYTPDPDYYLMDMMNMAWLFTSTAVGMSIGPLPFNFFPFINIRLMIFIYGTLSSLSSLLFPLADSIGFWPALICRFFAGFGQASQLHFTNDIVLRWTPKSEASFFFSIMLATSQFGPLITMALGGEMCSSQFFGWQSAYYILSVLTFLSTSLFAYFYSESVEKSSHLHANEKALILDGKNTSKKKDPVPYFALMTDPTILINFIIFIGYYLAMIVYQLFSPTIIKEVLNFTIRQTGYFSGIPLVIAIFIKICGGKLLDYNFNCSAKTKLAVPLVVIETVSAIALFLTGFLDDRVLALFFMLLFASLHTFVPVICSRTIQLRSAQHSHFALNLNMIIAGIAQILIPLGVSAAAPDNTKEQWTRIFYFLTAVIVTCVLIYVFFVNLDPAEWTKKPEENEEKKSEIDNEKFEDDLDRKEKETIQNKDESEELS